VDYELTEHARESRRKRSVIQESWLEQALTQPQRIEPDKVDPELEHGWCVSANTVGGCCG